MNKIDIRNIQKIIEGRQLKEGGEWMDDEYYNSPEVIKEL